MSVIVMGMEMPEVCITEGGWYHSCPMDRVWCAQRFAPEGYTFVQIFEDQEGKLPDWCPLRPLPKKHGRLIDGDELANGCDDPHWCRWLSEIEDMPTIVEAEGE